MTTYWVITTYWGKSERSPLQQLFATPFQAETFLSHMAPSYSGYSNRVRPATWREREERMFHPDPESERPVYEPVVWAEEQWWCNVAHHFKDHYLHISHLDPTSVAFTEDEVKGEADRQTGMRPGKYLQKFLGAGPSGEIEHGPMKGYPPQVTKMQIAFYASWHQQGKRPENEDILGFTEDPDEMVRLYENGPDSCMMGKGWRVEDHPVRVYAGGGLALAHMTSADGEVTGRALCWPSKEVFGRVYPTPNNPQERERYAELHARLKALGWKSIVEDNTVFEGALLTQVTNRYGSYVMPYLDNDYGVEEVYRNGKNWWRMTHDEDHQDNVDGTMARTEPDWTCDSCDEGFSDEYDSTAVYREWHVSGAMPGHRGGYPRGESYWCSNCRDNDAFYCDGSEEYYHENADNVYVNCETYERNWFLANGGWQCAVSDEYYFRNDDEPLALADGTLVHADCEADTFVCLATGLRWLRDYESEAVPGYHQAFDSWTEHPVEMAYALPAPLEDPEHMEAWARAYAYVPRIASQPVIVDGLSYSPTPYVAAYSRISATQPSLVADYL